MRPFPINSKFNRTIGALVFAVCLCACGSSNQSSDGSDESSKDVTACQRILDSFTSTELSPLAISFSQNWSEMEGSYEGAEAAWTLGAALETVGKTVRDSSANISQDAKQSFSDAGENMVDTGEWVALKGGSVDSLVASGMLQFADDLQMMGEFCSKVGITLPK
jgi:hypothetical protein